MWWLCSGVPYWGSLFQNRNTYVIYQEWLGFRPLLGFFISKYKHEILKVLVRAVFVPYWGSLFQNAYRADMNTFRPCRFRPLLGFFISKCASHARRAEKGNCFRPLLGFFISKCNKIQTCRSLINSFRPLLGFFISKFQF